MIILNVDSYLLSFISYQAICTEAGLMALRERRIRVALTTHVCPYCLCARASRSQLSIFDADKQKADESGKSCAGRFHQSQGERHVQEERGHTWGALSIVIIWHVSHISYFTRAKRDKLRLSSYNMCWTFVNRLLLLLKPVVARRKNNSLYRVKYIIPNPKLHKFTGLVNSELLINYLSWMMTRFPQTMISESLLLLAVVL